MENDVNKKNTNLINISNLIDNIKEQIKIQLNPFLFDEIIKFFNCLTLDNFIIDKIPDYFPKLINLNIKSLISQIYELDGNENRIKEINKLKDYLKTAPVPENNFGDAAKLLIEANEIKSLPIPHITKLIALLNQPDTVKLNGFLADPEINIDYFKLENQIIGKKLKNRELKNLSTLISQISKEKPSELSLYDRIITNQNQMNVFKDQFLYLNDREYSQTINGKINDSSFSNFEAKFSIKNNHIAYKIILGLHGGFIHNAWVKQESYQLLKFSSNFLHKHKNTTKKNSTILKNVDLIINERFINKKTAVLPCGTYNIEMGDRLNFFYTGHYLNFKNIKTHKITKFEIHDGGIDEDMKCINLENAKVKHEKWNNDSDYSDFIQYFKILEKKK